MEGACSKYRGLSDSQTNEHSNNEALGAQKESDLALTSEAPDTNLESYDTVKSHPSIFETILTTESQNLERDETYIEEEYLISLAQGSSPGEVHAASLADKETYSGEEVRTTESFISLKSEETRITGDFPSSFGEERPKITSRTSLSSEQAHDSKIPASVGEETRDAESPATQETRDAESPASAPEYGETIHSVGETLVFNSDEESSTAEACFTSLNVKKNKDEEHLESINGEDIFITEKCLAFDEQTSQHPGQFNFTRRNEGISADEQYSISFKDKSHVAKDHTSIGENTNDCEKFKDLLRRSCSPTSEVRSVSLEEIRSIEEGHIYRLKEKHTAEKNSNFFDGKTCMAFESHMTEEHLTSRDIERLSNQVYATFEKEICMSKLGIASLSEEPNAVEKSLAAHSNVDTQSVEEYLSVLRNETFLTSHNDKDVAPVLTGKGLEGETSALRTSQDLEAAKECLAIYPVENPHMNKTSTNGLDSKEQVPESVLNVPVSEVVENSLRISRESARAPSPIITDLEPSVINSSQNGNTGTSSCKELKMNLQPSEDSTSGLKLCQSLQGHQRNVLEKPENNDTDFKLIQLDEQFLSEHPRAAVFLQSESTVGFQELSDSTMQSDVKVQPDRDTLNDLFYTLNKELEAYKRGKKEIQKLNVLDNVREYVELHKKEPLDEALLANYDSDLVEAHLNQDIKRPFLKSEITLPEQKVTAQNNTLTNLEEDAGKSPSSTSECTSFQAMLNPGSELDVQSKQIERESRRINRAKTKVPQNVIPTTNQHQTVQRQIPVWKKCFLVGMALQTSFILLPCFIAFVFLLFLKRYF